MFLQSHEGNERVCLSIEPNEPRPFKDVMIQLTRDARPKHKYLVGTDIKLSQTKLQHLTIMKRFMDAPGRAWADRVIVGQLTARDRPKKYVNPQGEDLTDLVDEYEWPQRVQQPEEGQDLDDSGNEINADIPPPPDTSLIADMLAYDLAEDEHPPSLAGANPSPPVNVSLGEEPPSSSVQPIPPEPRPTTSSGAPGHNFYHLDLSFLYENRDSDSE